MQTHMEGSTSPPLWTQTKEPFRFCKIRIGKGTRGQHTSPESRTHYNHICTSQVCRPHVILVKVAAVALLVSGEEKKRIQHNVLQYYNILKYSIWYYTWYCCTSVTWIGYVTFRPYQFFFTSTKTKTRETYLARATLDLRGKLGALGQARRGKSFGYVPQSTWGLSAHPQASVSRRWRQPHTRWWCWPSLWYRTRASQRAPLVVLGRSSGCSTRPGCSAGGREGGEGWSKVVWRLAVRMITTAQRAIVYHTGRGVEVVRRIFIVS